MRGGGREGVGDRGTHAATQLTNEGMAGCANGMPMAPKVLMGRTTERIHGSLQGSLVHGETFTHPDRDTHTPDRLPSNTH